jgi:arabinose-5-phosphate isomerase
MIKINSFPILDENVSLKSALDSMSKYSLGVACFVNKKNQFVGILTDGDLRRLILNKQSPLPALLITSAIEFGTRSPKNIKENTLTGTKLFNARTTNHVSSKNTYPCRN